MEQIIVTKPDSTVVKLNTTNPITVVTKAEQSMTLMGDDVVNIVVECDANLNITVGDTLMAYGRKYTLLELPDIERINSKKLRYTMNFKGPIGLSQKVLYKLDGQLGVASTADFSLTANLFRFISLLVSNMGSEWSVGTIPDTETKTLTFQNETCQSVLNRLAEEYVYEYSIDFTAGSWVINFATKIGRDLPDSFAYGAGLGCIFVNRKNIIEESFITKLYAFGSENNLPSSYRNFSRRLKLPVEISADNEPPTPPQNLTVIQNPLFWAHLAWESSTDNVGVIEYIIYISYSGEEFTELDRTNSLTYDVADIPMDTEVRFKVNAVDAAGNKSRASNTVSLNIGIPLNPPVMLYGTVVSDTIEIVWEEPTTPYDTIELWREETRSWFTGDFVKIATIYAPDITFTDTPSSHVPGSGNYNRYKAVSVYEGFQSVFSNTIKISL